MDKEKKVLVNLIKSFVQNSKPEPLPEDLDLNKMMTMATINSVNGVIGYVFMTNPDLLPEASMLMRKMCMQTISMYATRASRMAALVKLLNKEGIDHLLFKGYVVRELYPVPELRSFGDVDFLIRVEDRQKCDELMIREGFERKTDWEPVYSYARDLEYYEIHTDVMEIDVSDKADYKGYYKAVWDHAYKKDENSHTYYLDDEYHLMYLLTHIAKHIASSGAGIRMYLDIAFYLQKYRDIIDWNHFKEELKVLAFEDFVNMVFSAVQKWFGVESPIELRPIDDEVMDNFLDFTLDGGTFGHYGRDGGLDALKKDSRNDTEEVNRTRTLLRRAFPSASTIESRYTYLQGKHWLLPVAWVHRLIKTRDSFGEHVQQAKSIMETDDEEVLKLRRMYKEIGL